ncbi:MAG: hypothetical protein UT24_C0018G0019 [Candidatus Woesebacteria bacterium GW2011_GWB1_39_12]|uniref:Uncharacterized protein n=1 Tax=Candidatus Woesebacteria bacterium GW2011_GWB1_39_12 TaxID=1618574 RepID=A0A0G0QE83_9BACT|nr:MAG: hypothetical protein UT24_C0018G0019 [Candidatus Woesebacteria bacterium GW2011_GWB1_39_12]
MSGIPNFVLKNQRHLLSQPQGEEVENGVIWIFDSPKGETTITRFDGTFGREWIISYPSNEHPSEVYGAEYSPEIHGDVAYETESTEDDRDIEHALEMLFGGITNSLDFERLFPNLSVSQKGADWLLAIPNSEIYFLAREGEEGYNIVFVNDDEVEQGGPFEDSAGIKQFVYGILQTLKQEEKLKETEKPKIEEFVSDENTELLHAASRKIASACSDIDKTGNYQISDALAMVMQSIAIVIEGEE